MGNLEDQLTNTNLTTTKTGRATFKSVSPARFTSPSNTNLNQPSINNAHLNTTGNSSGSRQNANNQGSITNLSGSTRQLLMIRKNNYRQTQLKKIDTENLKIFQNLLRIRSQMSKQKLGSHAKENNNLKQLLAHYDNRLDPLISIEQKMK